MSQWKNTLVSPEHTVKQTIEVIAKDSLQVALVVNSGMKLLGMVTDGDFRRGVLKGIELEDPVTKIMSQSPTTASCHEKLGTLRHLMQKKKIRHLPLINDTEEVTGLLTLMNFLENNEKGNYIVIMAGGLGTRLGELTKNAPKPLLQVGNKPILETLIENFVEHGFKNIFLSVNYLGEKIKDHFGGGKAWGANIQYLQESQRLGTAGSLSLLNEVSEQMPLIVMNGDILTKVNFSQLLDFHHEHEADATMCVREYDFQVPYGVVDLNREIITNIEEKPVQSFFVNAGIYVLSPCAAQLVPKDRYFDMTDLFNLLLQHSKSVIAFPLREYWIDIGRSEDFVKANHDYVQIFDN
jgi:dTDP-glucose pyrophosphorylase